MERAGDRRGLREGAPSRRARAGVTLIEMLIVLALIGLMTAITYPAVASGVERLRLRSAGDSVAGFFTGAMNWAERRQQAVVLVIDSSQNRLTARSEKPGFEQRLELSGGVRIAPAEPDRWAEEEAPRQFLIYPGGPPPAVAVTLVNSRGVSETVRIDPVTGVPEILSGQLR